MPSSDLNDGTPTNDPAAALHWAAAALQLAEAREQRGTPLVDSELAVCQRYQAAAHSHGITDAQIRDYLNNTLR